MSEEEKKAIEIIKGLSIEEYEWYEDSKYCKGHSEEAVTIVEDSLKTILNLIDKQQNKIDSQYYSDLELYYVLKSYIGQFKKVINELLKE